MSEQKERKITISDAAISWEGFANLYELIGFVELRANPMMLKQQVAEQFQRDAQRPSPVSGQ